jgi:hypothetical protein
VLFQEVNLTTRVSENKKVIAWETNRYENLHRFFEVKQHEKIGFLLKEYIEYKGY